ncbi:MAG: hypothetical protein K2N25_04215 [Muribaculaceae bacterium]|nr:hypothetical protein [Muribaculaceae bacterium]
MKTKKKVIRLTESDLHKIVRKTVNRLLRENDDFISHAFKPTSNHDGNGLQVSNDGSMVRLQFPNGEITDWLEVNFDENGVGYVTTPDGEEERLDEYMRCGAF